MTATEKAVAARPYRSRKRRRVMGALAALLAVAVAVPLGVQLADTGAEPDPKAHAGGGVGIGAAEAKKRAKASGKDVEVTAERSANTTVWALPNGRFKAHVYSGAIRAKVGDQWKPIDTDLARVDGGFAPKAVNGKIVFSAGGKASAASGAGSGAGTSTNGQRASRTVTRVSLATDAPIPPAWTELVRLTTDGHEVSVSWPGPLPEPVVAGPRALYENVRPGIDLLMTAQDGGYSHLLIVKDKKAAEDPLLGQLNYRLGSSDLTFHLDGASHALSARDSAGTEVVGAPTPLMWDSAAKRGPATGEQPTAPLPGADIHPTLALPGLAGAEGAHMAAATATLAADNLLTVTPNNGLLSGADTVYPVFIDPSFKSRKHSWTLLYKNEPSSSFFNGQNYNGASGTSEARVGYETQTYGTARSVFNFDFDSKLHGITAHSATLRGLETHSWSCTPSGLDIYQTPYVDSSSSWSNTNNSSFWSNWVTSTSVAHGNEPKGCPDNWVAVDVKKAVDKGAAQGWGAITFGLRAQNEGDTNSWKKFLANGENAPYIEIEFNRPPDTPVRANMTSFPGGTCVTDAPYPLIGKTDLQFQAKSADQDGNLKRLAIKVWEAGNGANVAYYSDQLETNSDGVATTPAIGWSTFQAGKTYAWAAWAIDGEEQWSAGGPADGPGGVGKWCAFTVDHTAPSTPLVKSEDFPAPGPDGAEWSKNTLGPGKATISANGYKVEDIKEFQWSLNQPGYGMKATPDAAGNAVIDVTPGQAGPNVLYARTVSKAGNVSTHTAYLFYVRPKAGLDGTGDVTGDQLADVLAIDKDGNLRVYPGDTIGDIDAWMPAATDAGAPAPAGYWKDQATGKTALISHSTDWLPGDGLTDLLARMPDGKLYVYPGDGNGRFDISRRMEVLLPAGSPDPATLTQLVTTEDVTGDGLPDAFARAGDAFWAFTGYTGVSFTQARLMSATSWTGRDIIGVRDISGDKIPDLLFRDDATAGRGLALRKGKPAAGGGVDLASLATAAASDGGGDQTYGTTGWGRATWPLVRGTTDVSGDGIPDFYLSRNDGSLHLVRGGTTSALWEAGVDEEDWNTFTAIG